MAKALPGSRFWRWSGGQMALGLAAWRRRHHREVAEVLVWEIAGQHRPSRCCLEHGFDIAFPSLPSNHQECLDSNRVHERGISP